MFKLFCIHCLWVTDSVVTFETAFSTWQYVKGLTASNRSFGITNVFEDETCLFSWNHLTVGVGWPSTEQVNMTDVDVFDIVMIGLCKSKRQNQIKIKCISMNEWMNISIPFISKFISSTTLQFFLNCYQWGPRVFKVYIRTTEVIYQVSAQLNN